MYLESTLFVSFVIQEPNYLLSPPNPLPHKSVLHKMAVGVGVGEGVGAGIFYNPNLIMLCLSKVPLCMQRKSKLFSQGLDQCCLMETPHESRK